MIFTKKKPKKTKVIDVALIIEGSAIGEASNTIFLGVYTDNKLT